MKLFVKDKENKTIIVTENQVKTLSEKTEKTESNRVVIITQEQAEKLAK